MSLLNYTKRHLYTKEGTLFIIAFCVRIALFCLLTWWFLFMHPSVYGGMSYPVLGGDSWDYAQLASNMWQGHGFSSSTQAPYFPESFRVPGYSFYLYLFEWLPQPLAIATIVQIAFAAATVVLFFKLSKKFLPEKISYLAALLYCFEPTSVFLSTIIMSDTIFVFAMILGIYLLFQKADTFKRKLVLHLVAGIIFGYAVLLRAIAQYLAVCIIAARLVIFRQELKPYQQTAGAMLIFFAAMMLATLPWALRNHHEFNTYTLSATPYINFTQYNLPYFYAYQHHVSMDIAQKVFTDPVPYSPAAPQFQSLLNEAVFKREMRDGLQGNVIPYAKFHLIKTLPFFLNDSLRDINRVVGIFPPPSHVTNFTDLLLKKDIRGITLFFLTPEPDLWMLVVGSTAWVLVSALMFFAVVWTVLKRKENVWFILTCLGIVMYFAILSSPVIQPRYRMPAAPFMILLAAEGAAVLGSTAKKRFSAR